MNDSLTSFLLGLLLGITFATHFAYNKEKEYNPGLYEKCSLLYPIFNDRIDCIITLEDESGIVTDLLRD